MSLSLHQSMLLNAAYATYREGSADDLGSRVMAINFFGDDPAPKATRNAIVRLRQDGYLEEVGQREIAKRYRDHDCRFFIVTQKGILAGSKVNEDLDNALEHV